MDRLNGTPRLVAGQLYVPLVFTVRRLLKPVPVRSFLGWRVTYDLTGAEGTVVVNVGSARERSAFRFRGKVGTLEAPSDAPYQQQSALILSEKELREAPITFESYSNGIFEYDVMLYPPETKEKDNG